MPELPEVESVRISLSSCLPGRRVESVRIFREGVLLSPPDRLIGLVIVDLERRGKYLQLNLSDGSRLLVHLRMTGRLCFSESCPEPEKHTHVQMILSPGGCLTYTDNRRFGRLQQFDRDQPLSKTAFAGMEALGPEPLGSNLTVGHLAQVCRRHARAPVKSLLLNQQVIAGLGNIYADESLFLAGIHPLTLSGQLTKAKRADLLAAIQTVIGTAIDHRGTTLRDYVDGHRIPGTFQYELKVYGRKGQPCKTCDSAIECVKSAGRTTCYCPVCQKMAKKRPPVARRS